MKLIVITQKVDNEDSNLSFFHRWLEKLAQRVDKLYVVCLWEGKHSLAANTEIFSLGKEKGYSKIRQLVRLQTFLFKHLSQTEGVFAHMCPIYAVASFPLVKLYNKKLILWFTHGTVKWKLKLAEKVVDSILTASEESCRLKSRRKIRVVGHGIDTDFFYPQALTEKSSNEFRIASVGRISPTKDQTTLVSAIDILVNTKGIKNIRVQIVGAPIDETGEKYLQKIRDLVAEKRLDDYIEFAGSVPYSKIPEVYRRADLAVNLSHTGSIDKVVLEAMASGCQVITCNEAFTDLLEEKYMFEKSNAQNLADKIINLKNSKTKESLRERVIKSHSLDNLMDKVIKFFRGKL